MKLFHLQSDDEMPVVVCEGHVDRAAFAKAVDTDAVADLLGDDFKGKSYPTKTDERRIAAMTRHSWGDWSSEGSHRRWDELHKDEPGARPFTVLDQEGNP